MNELVKLMETYVNESSVGREGHKHLYIHKSKKEIMIYLQPRVIYSDEECCLTVRENFMSMAGRPDSTVIYVNNETWDEAKKKTKKLIWYQLIKKLVDIKKKEIEGNYVQHIDIVENNDKTVIGMSDETDFREIANRCCREVARLWRNIIFYNYFQHYTEWMYPEEFDEKLKPKITKLEFENTEFQEILTSKAATINEIREIWFL